MLQSTLILQIYIFVSFPMTPCLLSLFALSESWSTGGPSHGGNPDGYPAPHQAAPMGEHCAGLPAHCLGMVSTTETDT